MDKVSTLLPEQPFFYPVVIESYATQIARDWNTRDGGTGYVLKFRLEADSLAKYEVLAAGAAVHREYWIPSEELEEFQGSQPWTTRQLIRDRVQGFRGITDLGRWGISARRE